MSVVDLDQARRRLRSRGVAMLDLDALRSHVEASPGGGLTVHVDTALDSIEIAITAEQLAAALRGAP